MSLVLNFFQNLFVKCTKTHPQKENNTKNKEPDDLDGEKIVSITMSNPNREQIEKNDEKMNEDYKWIYSTIHTILIATWLFFIIFGNVRENQQLSHLDLICDNDEVSQHTYNSECQSSRPYNVAYHILSLIGSLLGFAQIYFVMRRFFYEKIALRIFDVFFMFRDHIVHSSFLCPYIGSIYVYHFLQYNVFFCHTSSTFCDQKPEIYDVVHNIYLSFIVFLSIYLFTQICCIGLFLYLFFKHKMQPWHHICQIEDNLCLIKEYFETSKLKLNVSRTRQIRDFVTKWTEMEDDNIEERVHQHAEKIIRVLKQRLFNRTQNYPGSEMLSNDSFDVSPIKETDAQDFRHELPNLWHFLTYENTYKDICVESIEDAFYKLFFLRKELANAIKTDRNIISSLFKYLSLVLYPAGIIAITRIFGYQNAFGEGVDLFKTYLLGLSILTSHLLGHLKFIALMLNIRPINIGDVILFDGSTFRVHDISFTHIYLKGPYYAVLPNENFTNEKMVNLSRASVSDMCQVSFPIITTHKRMNAERFKQLFDEYNELFPKDVDLSTVRCGWMSALENKKIMQCHWRYKFRIFNRSRHNQVRTRIIDFLHHKCGAIIAEDAMQLKLASGGFHPKNSGP